MATKNRSTMCSIETASQTRGKDEIVQGKVGEVRQQFQVHEDTALAYKIQSEEIQNHVSRNREERKSVRDNIKTAKETYLEEVKSAGVLPESSVAEIEQKRWLAKELHKRVEEQEDMVKAESDEQKRKDEEIALRLQRKEDKELKYWEHKRREKLIKAEEEHRHLKKIIKDIETANLSDDIEQQHASTIAPDDLSGQLAETTEIITLADGIVIDAKHNEVQTEEQKKQHMEKRDKELAKILQEQENIQIEKQKNIHEDRRKAIELQDREIAKHLQRQEKAKAERRREKLRRGQSLPEKDEFPSSNKRHLPTYHEAIGVDDLERETQHHNNTPYTMDPERKSKSLEERRNHRKSQEKEHENVLFQRDNSVESGETERLRDVSDPGAHYDNIAEALDPTFQRIPHQSSTLMDQYGEHQTGNKSAQMVPPLKRKASKDRSKKECKQQ